MLFAHTQPSLDRPDSRTPHYHCIQTRMKKKLKNDALEPNHRHRHIGRRRLLDTVVAIDGASSPTNDAIVIKHEKPVLNFKKIFPIIN